jgi:chitinase
MERCMTILRHGTTCLLLALATPGLALATTPDDTGRPFDQYTWVTTHNAFTSNGTVPNQTQTIAEQLEDGVRGFMLDLH